MASASFNTIERCVTLLLAVTILSLAYNLPKPSLRLSGSLKVMSDSLSDIDTAKKYNGPPQPSSRSNIESFKVMDVVLRANQLQREGRSICHLEVGQPSTGAPKPVLKAARDLIDTDILAYTNANGIPDLRSKIAQHYFDKYKTIVSPERIVVTTGSSAGFNLAFLGCFDVGEMIALCSSGYPCYRNLMKATGLHSVNIPVNSEFKITAVELNFEIERRKLLGEQRLSGLIMSSPGNPTGAMLTPAELKALCEVCQENNILFLSDEIYHGISFGPNGERKEEASSVQYSKSSLVINSFSKYFSMTGWRLGWMVVPESLIDVMNRLSQNLYINAPTLSQMAACHAFDPESIVELEEHVKRYAINRQVVLDVLSELGLSSAASPADGAFYVYVDLYPFGVTNSTELCSRLLEETGLALTSGCDFEDPEGELGNHRVRFSYSRSTDEVTEGMRRFKDWWVKNMKETIYR